MKKTECIQWFNSLWSHFLQEYFEMFGLCMTLSVFYIVKGIFGPLFFTLLIQLINICGNLLLYSPLKSNSSVGVITEFWVMTKLWFFSFPVSLLWICCSDVIQFQPDFICQTDELTFDYSTVWFIGDFMADLMTARYPGYVASQNHHPFTIGTGTQNKVFVICCV